MNNLNPTLLCDWYKIGHRVQFPKGTETVYSTWTARDSRNKDIKHTVAFGLQRFILRYLDEYFRDNFFDLPIGYVVDDYSRIVRNCLGVETPETDHLRALHALGYLPLEIRAIPEGTLVPIRVPWMTIENTDPEFYWLPNWIETLLSTELWQATTSATIANEYRKVLDFWAQKTNPEGAEGVQFQGHDFSMRGMSSVESGVASGLGHLLSFVGTDTIPAILEAERYYEADVEKELVGTSISASEHAVMCAGGKDDELETYRRLLTEVYPSGFISLVSDTWDLFFCITEIIGKELHDVIMERDGRCVVRPDSGNPVDILCGNPGSDPSDPVFKGVIELLWDYFGGTITSTGYKVLDSHVGAIYGDAITVDRAEQICQRLEAKGFASTNAILGIGSFSYQYNTRDTFGHAMKATWVQIDGEERNIFKDPVTDSGMKKSLTGRVVVFRNSNGELQVRDGLDQAQQEELFGIDELQTVFLNGTTPYIQNFGNIRNRLADERKRLG